MAKRVPPLTAARLSKLKPHPEKVLELVDGAVPGLRVRVTPAGTRSWSLNIRANGVMRRFDVGSGLGLAEARSRGEELRRRIKAGADPTAEKRANRRRMQLAAQGIGSFDSVVEAYFMTGTGAGLATRQEQLRRIRSVFCEHLGRPAKDVVASELQWSIDLHPAKTSAARAASYLAPVLRWAEKRDLVSGSFNLEKPLLDAPTQRVLTDEELGVLLPSFNGSYGRLCKFVLLTGARISEACNARWSSIDPEANTWTLQPEHLKDTRTQGRRRRKPKGAMVVPLSRQALDLLAKVRASEIARRQQRDLPWEIDGEDLIFVGPKGGKLGNWDRWLKTVAKSTGVSGWSVHALRRTTATLAGELGTPPHIVSALLGHGNIGGSLVAGYNQSRYFSEHTQALQNVADRLDDIAQRSEV